MRAVISEQPSQIDGADQPAPVLEEVLRQREAEDGEWDRHYDRLHGERLPEEPSVHGGGY